MFDSGHTYLLLTSHRNPGMVVVMAGTRSQPPGIELAQRVGQESRYYFLSQGPGPGKWLRVLYGGFEQCLPDYQIARPRFPHHCLEVIVGGRGMVEVGSTWKEIREGAVYLHCSGRPWRMRGTGNDGLRKFFVVFDRPDARVTGMLRTRPMPFRFEPLWELVTLLETLEREARHPSAERQAICDGLLQIILRKLRTQEPSSDTSGSRSWQTYLAAARFIEEHFRDIRGSGELAERVGVDASYLCRLFQRHGGMSPHRHLTRLRMQYAMTLLTREGLNVTAVAEALGFQNPFHFSRVFKTVHGFPPSACFRTADAAAPAEN